MSPCIVLFISIVFFSEYCINYITSLCGRKCRLTGISGFLRQVHGPIHLILSIMASLPTVFPSARTTVTDLFFSPADCLLSIVPIAAAEKRTLSNLLESVLSKMLIHRTCTGNVPVYCPVCCQTIVFSICFLQKPLPYVIQSFYSFMVRINSTPYFLKTSVLFLSQDFFIVRKKPASGRIVCADDVSDH